MLAEVFATAAGVWPHPEDHPELTRVLRFGPMLPERYRLSADADAALRFASATAGFVAPPEHVALHAGLVARLERELA